ncbi:MAG: lipid-binding SYLF domain-containing protein [Deltaproteobacteria bacterium]|nr:lipid-binding SYLF domain-containing protein [Candidatus Deferrimicrobiaceae bacterium]
MKGVSLVLLPVVALMVSMASQPAWAEGKEGEKVESAASVLEEIMKIPETGIPPTLLENANGIAIVPGLIKVGFVVGGRYGTGILAIREKDGGWSNPVFVSLAGGSVGWQIGAESTDVVLVFKSKKSIDGIMKGKFTLGADAAVAAGPVGRRAEAATDERLKAEIYSYSRSRGLFAGVSLEGSALQIDDEADAAYYGKAGIRPADILSGKDLKAPPSADRLRKALATHASTKPAGN